MYISSKILLLFDYLENYLYNNKKYYCVHTRYFFHMDVLSYLKPILLSPHTIFNCSHPSLSKHELKARVNRNHTSSDWRIVHSQKNTFERQTRFEYLLRVCIKFQQRSYQICKVVSNIAMCG